MKRARILQAPIDDLGRLRRKLVVHGLMTEERAAAFVRRLRAWGGR